MVLVATMPKLFPILNAVVRDPAPRSRILRLRSLSLAANPIAGQLPHSPRQHRYHLFDIDDKSIGIRFQVDCTTDKHILFTYPSLDDEERRVEEVTTQLRHDLRHYMEAEPRRWTGLLARMTRARALIGSNSC